MLTHNNFVLLMQLPVSGDRDCVSSLIVWNEQKAANTCNQMCRESQLSRHRLRWWRGTDELFFLSPCGRAIRQSVSSCLDLFYEPRKKGCCTAADASTLANDSLGGLSTKHAIIACCLPECRVSLPKKQPLLNCNFVHSFMVTLT